MREPISQHHRIDANGNPAGGESVGVGFRIDWQNGATREPGGAPIGRNGAFVEEVIEACVGRIEHYQKSKFHCLHNAVALGHLHAALLALDERTKERQDRGVEGKHIQ